MKSKAFEYDIVAAHAYDGDIDELEGYWYLGGTAPKWTQWNPWNPQADAKEHLSSVWGCGEDESL